MTGYTVRWVYQGSCLVSARPDLCLMTVLGSCIAVCMHDPIARCGGMNHFLLPELAESEHAIDRLIQAIAAEGGRRERLQTKIFGGANVLAGVSDIGARNAAFVERFLAQARLPVSAADLRGTLPRKLRYFPASGRAELRSRHAKTG